MSPHRDDAAFSLGLSVCNWLASGHQVTVLNCSTVSDAPYSDVESIDANDCVSFVSAVRRREGIAWGKLAGGRIRFHSLDLQGASIRLACSSAEAQTEDIRPGNGPPARVAGALAELIRNTPANCQAIALPLAAGGHIHHRATRDAGFAAFRNEACPFALYKDLPGAARSGMAGTLPKMAENTRFELQPCIVLPEASDVSERIARKANVAERYDSQIDSDEVRPIGEFCAFYGGRERLWANSAWRDADLCRRAEKQV